MLEQEKTLTYSGMATSCKDMPVWQVWRNCTDAAVPLYSSSAT
jgi:hypothetical protein